MAAKWTNRVVRVSATTLIRQHLDEAGPRFFIGVTRPDQQAAEVANLPFRTA